MSTAIESSAAAGRASQYASDVPLAIPVEHRDQSHFEAYFDRSLTFHSKYQRNNKKGGRKHLRCFPCCATKHTINAACAIPVTIKCLTSIDNARDAAILLALARFSGSDEESSFPNGDIRIGDIVTTESIKHLLRTANEPLKPVYSAKVSETKILPADNVCETSFVFKESCWHYGWTGGRYRSEVEHRLKIYIFRPLDRLPVNDITAVTDPSHKMECVYIVQSPPFTIYSSRSAPPAYMRVSDSETNTNADSPPITDHESVSKDGTTKTTPKKRKVDEDEEEDDSIIDNDDAIGNHTQAAKSILSFAPPVNKKACNKVDQKEKKSKKNNNKTIAEDGETSPPQGKPRKRRLKSDTKLESKRRESGDTGSESTHSGSNLGVDVFNNINTSKSFAPFVPQIYHPMFNSTNSNANSNNTAPFQFQQPQQQQMMYNPTDFKQFESIAAQYSQVQRPEQNRINFAQPSPQNMMVHLPIGYPTNTYNTNMNPTWSSNSIYPNQNDGRRLSDINSLAGNSLDESRSRPSHSLDGVDLNQNNNNGRLDPSHSLDDQIIGSMDPSRSQPSHSLDDVILVPSVNANVGNFQNSLYSAPLYADPLQSINSDSFINRSASMNSNTIGSLASSASGPMLTTSPMYFKEANEGGIGYAPFTNMNMSNNYIPNLAGNNKLQSNEDDMATLQFSEDIDGITDEFPGLIPFTSFPDRVLNEERPLNARTSVSASTAVIGNQLGKDSSMIESLRNKIANESSSSTTTPPKQQDYVIDPFAKAWHSLVVSKSMTREAYDEHLAKMPSAPSHKFGETNPSAPSIPAAATTASAIHHDDSLNEEKHITPSAPSDADHLPIAVPSSNSMINSSMPPNQPFDMVLVHAEPDTSHHVLRDGFFIRRPKCTCVTGTALFVLLFSIVCFSVSFGYYSTTVIPSSIYDSLPSYCDEYVSNTKKTAPSQVTNGGVNCQRPDDRFPCTGPNCPCAGGVVDNGGGGSSGSSAYEDDQTSYPTQVPSKAPSSLPTKKPTATNPPTLGQNEKNSLNESLESECKKIQSELDQVANAKRVKNQALISSIVGAVLFFISMTYFIVIFFKPNLMKKDKKEVVVVQTSSDDSANRNVNNNSGNTHAVEEHNREASQSGGVVTAV